MITLHFDKYNVASVRVWSALKHGNKDPHFHSHVNGHEVAQVPAEQSLHQVAQVRQQQEQVAHVFAQQQTQNPNLDPTTPRGPKLV